MFMYMILQQNLVVCVSYKKLLICEYQGISRLINKRPELVPKSRCENKYILRNPKPDVQKEYYIA